MPRSVLAVIASATLGCAGGSMAARPDSDAVPAQHGNIVISPITHGTLQITYGSHVILVDPTIYAGYDGAGRLLVNFENLDPPTLILVTDTHGDHWDSDAIRALRMPGTRILGPATVTSSVDGAFAIANGESKMVDGVLVEAVPMYNLRRGYHPKGRGNGYLLTLGGKRIYVAGDTECTPEMKALENVDVAFLPMNLPYTMAPIEAASCTSVFKPSIVYPYHYKGQNVAEFAKAIEGSGIQVRLRDWYVGPR